MGIIKIQHDPDSTIDLLAVIIEIVLFSFLCLSVYLLNIIDDSSYFWSTAFAFSAPLVIETAKSVIYRDRTKTVGHYITNVVFMILGFVLAVFGFFSLLDNGNIAENELISQYAIIVLGVFAGVKLVMIVTLIYQYYWEEKLGRKV